MYARMSQSGPSRTSGYPNAGTTPSRPLQGLQERTAVHNEDEDLARAIEASLRSAADEQATAEDRDLARALALSREEEEKERQRREHDTSAALFDEAQRYAFHFHDLCVCRRRLTGVSQPSGAAARPPHRCVPPIAVCADWRAATDAAPVPDAVPAASPATASVHVSPAAADVVQSIYPDDAGTSSRKSHRPLRASDVLITNGCLARLLSTAAATAASRPNSAAVHRPARAGSPAAGAAAHRSFALEQPVCSLSCPSCMGEPGPLESERGPFVHRKSERSKRAQASNIQPHGDVRGPVTFPGQVWRGAPILVLAGTRQRARPRKGGRAGEGAGVRACAAAAA